MRLHHAQAEEAMLGLQKKRDLQLTQAVAYEFRITQQEAELSHLHEQLHAASDENTMLRNQLDKFQQQNENGATGLADLRAELEVEKAAKELAVMGKDEAERKVSEMEKAQADAMAALRRIGRIGC
jgi:predicted RNase H-like nuclease (RuvC/YqgF family)